MSSNSETAYMSLCSFAFLSQPLLITVVPLSVDYPLKKKEFKSASIVETVKEITWLGIQAKERGERS